MSGDEAKIVWLPLDALTKDPFNIRDDEEPSPVVVERLSRLGFMASDVEPLVRRLGEGRYGVVDGWKRCVAARRAGLDMIRCKLVEMNDVRAWVESYLLNSEHRPLTLRDRIRAYKLAMKLSDGDIEAFYRLITTEYGTPERVVSDLEGVRDVIGELAQRTPAGSGRLSTSPRAGPRPSVEHSLDGEEPQPLEASRPESPPGEVEHAEAPRAVETREQLVAGVPAGNAAVVQRAGEDAQQQPAEKPLDPDERLDALLRELELRGLHIDSSTKELADAFVLTMREDLHYYQLSGSGLKVLSCPSGFHLLRCPSCGMPVFCRECGSPR
ncbi:MAG: hypothetical protein NXY59_02250 [Aigarchaeota archaeon]|nr:hypothetical protein [Candidatus Pelearchaeum maunauluense]